MPSDGEDPTPEILGVWSNPLLQLLPVPLTPGVVVLVYIPSIGQLERFENYSYSLGILDAIQLSVIGIKKSYLRLYNCV